MTIYTYFIERGTKIDSAIPCFTLDLKEQCKNWKGEIKGKRFQKTELDGKYSHYWNLNLV